MEYDQKVEAFLLQLSITQARRRTSSSLAEQDVVISPEQFLRFGQFCYFCDRAVDVCRQHRGSDISLREIERILSETTFFGAGTIAAVLSDIPDWARA